MKAKGVSRESEKFEPSYKNAFGAGHRRLTACGHLSKTLGTMKWHRVLERTGQNQVRIMLK